MPAPVPASATQPAFLAAELAELAASANRLAEAAAEISGLLEVYAATSGQPVMAPAPPAAPRGMPLSLPVGAVELPPTGMPAELPSAPPVSQPASMPGAQAAVSAPAGMPPQTADPEAFYRAQLLWDETMATSVAGARECDPRCRVMLIVGGFHVIRDGGTTQKTRSRLPGDQIVTVAYSGTSDPALAFDSDDCGAADIIIYGIQAPPEPKGSKAGGMPPMTRPAPAPAPATAPT